MGGEIQQPVLLALFLLTAAAAYFLGCVNGSILASRYLFRDDVRTHGSGNAGLTNFYRTYGTKGVVIVLGCDIVKAVLAVSLGGFLLGCYADLAMVGKLLATTFVLLGHMYPVMFRFHGEKAFCPASRRFLLSTGAWDFWRWWSFCFWPVRHVMYRWGLFAEHCRFLCFYGCSIIMRFLRCWRFCRWHC